MFVSRHNKFDWKFARDYAEICQVLSEQVHSRYLSGCRSISILVVALDHFNKFKPSNIPMEKIYFCLSDEND